MPPSLPLVLVLTTLSLALLVMGHTAIKEPDTCHSVSMAWMVATVTTLQNGILEMTVATRQSMKILHDKTQEIMVPISAQVMHATNNWISLHFVCSGDETNLATTGVTTQQLLIRVSSDLLAKASVALCTLLTTTSWLFAIRPILIEAFSSGIVRQAPFIAQQVVNLLYMTIIYIGGKTLCLACLVATRLARPIVLAVGQAIPVFFRDPRALSIPVMTMLGIFLASNNLKEAAVSNYNVQNNRRDF